MLRNLVRPLTRPLVSGLMGGAAAPLPNGSRIVYAGDSITAASQSSLTYPAFFPRGYATWAQMFSGHRAYHGYRANQGVSGNRTNQLLARFSDVITELQLSPLGQRLCVLLIGTNDISDNTASGTITANIASMLSQLRAVGSRIILLKVLPRGAVGATMTGTQIAIWEAVNSWIASQAAPDLTVIDAESVIGNMDASHTLAAGMSNDNLHPTARGAYRIGQLVANAINSFVASADVLPTSAGDQTNALSGINPFFTGTSGTASNGATGTVATGWTVSAANSLTGQTAIRTFASSVITHPQGYGQYQQIDFDFDYSGDNRNVRCSRSATITGFNLGDVVEVLAEVQWDNNLQNVRAITFTLQSQNLIAMGSSTVDTIFADGAFSGVVRSKPFILTSNLTSTNVWCEANLSQAGASTLVARGTIRWGRICLRKTVQ
jgi:lysophospholipase L1-like esterase